MLRSNGRMLTYTGDGASTEKCQQKLFRAPRVQTDRPDKNQCKSVPEPSWNQNIMVSANATRVHKLDCRDVTRTHTEHMMFWVKGKDTPKTHHKGNSS